MNWIVASFYGDKVYLPVMARTNVGVYWETGTVIMCNAETQNLAAVLQTLRDTETPSIPHPTRSERNRMDPSQKAMGFRSWRKMAEAGVIGCGVYWTDDGIYVYFSQPDDASVFGAHEIRLPPDTPLEVIVEQILDYVRKRQAKETDR